MTKLVPYLVYFTALTLAIAALFRPKYALFFTVPLLPFRIILAHMQHFPMGKDIVDILFMAMIVGTVLNSSDYRLEGAAGSPLVRLVQFKAVFLVFSLFIGSAFFGLGNPIDLADPRFLNFKNYMMMPILFFLTHRLVTTKKDIETLVIILIVALFVADAKYALDNRYRTFSTFSWDYKEAGIFMMLGGNILAAFKVHFLFLALSMYFYEARKWLKMFFLGVAGFTVYPILFLFSRGAYVALWAGLAYIGARKSKLILAAVLIVPILWTTVLPVAVVERIQMTEEGGELDHSAASRLDLWKLCLGMFAKSPLFGVGWDTFEFVGGRDDPHNAFFEILGEQGLIGIVLIFGMLFLTWRNGVWLQKNAPDDQLRGLGLAAQVVTLACFVTNMFGDRWSYIEVGAFYFVLMALASKARIIATLPLPVEEPPGAPDARPSDGPRAVPSRP